MHFLDAPNDLPPEFRLILGLGNKFVPFLRPHPLAVRRSFLQSIQDLRRRIVTAMTFWWTPFIPSVIPRIEVKSNWVCTEDFVPIVDNYIERLNTFCNNKHFSSSIPKTHKFVNDILTRIKKREDIVIKPADKNLGICAIGKATYINLCMDHLNDIHTYQVNHNPFWLSEAYGQLRMILNNHGVLYELAKRRDVNNMPVRTNKLTKLARSLLQLESSNKVRAANFYCIIKMHKHPPTGRPIASSINTVSNHTSKYLHNMLKPLLKILDGVCNSSRDVLIDIAKNKITNLDANARILTADIKSLYPSIPIAYGIAAVKKVVTYFKDMLHYTQADVDLIIDLLTWLLNNNYIDFNGITYRQIDGTAMGTPVAPAYAIITIWYLESKIKYKYRYKIIYWSRYIDDLFIVVRDNETAENIVNDFNAVIPGKITLDAIHVLRKGIYLDLELNINNRGGITSKVYQKDMNNYLYIPPQSSHPRHIMLNVIRQEIIRYRLNCSDSNDFRAACKLFQQRLRDRGYSNTYLRPLFENTPNRNQLLANLINKGPKQVTKLSGPVVTINLPRLKHSIQLKTLFAPSLELRNRFEYNQAFTNGDPIIGRSSNPSIGSQLCFIKVHSTLNNELEPHIN